jgi:hypothetical protein
MSLVVAAWRPCNGLRDLSRIGVVAPVGILEQWQLIRLCDLRNYLPADHLAEMWKGSGEC